MVATMQCYIDTSSKWFLEALGPDGLAKMLTAYEDKSAQAVCTFAYGETGMEPICFQGRTDVRSRPLRDRLDPIH